MLQFNIHSTTPFKMIARHNYYAALEEVRRFQKEASLAVRTEAIDNILTEISKTAVEDYMRRGSGYDRNKLTIESGRLASAVRDKSHPAHIQKVMTTATGSRGRGMVGVEASPQLPYPHIHEQGGKKGSTRKIQAQNFPVMRFEYPKHTGNIVAAEEVNIPSRPYLHPARDKVVGDDAVGAINKEIRNVIHTKAFITYGGGIG